MTVPHPISIISEGSTMQFENSPSWNLELHPGPYWNSYDQLKQAGSTAFERIQSHAVGTVVTKSGIYRVLRDTDYQKLLGLAKDVHRIKVGVRCVISGVKVVQKHRDQESIDLLMQTVAMLSESKVLPEQEGHGQFEISAEEAAENAEYVDLNAIPRPTLTAK